MIYLVGKAEAYLQSQAAWDITITNGPVEHDRDAGLWLAESRSRIADAAGFPVIMRRYTDPETVAFVSRRDLESIAQQGPATPDHVIRTKRLPLIGGDIDAYATAYKAYFTENEPLAKARKTMLDPAPRVVLDPLFGMCTVGRSAKEAGITADISRHTMVVIQRAEKLDGYRALPARDIFDMEYWDLEQAKLKKAGRLSRFAGEIALVTGAASGIGKACVDALLASGAVVVGVDIDPGIETLYTRPDYLGLVGDVTSESRLREVLTKTADAFGGLDMLVLNAGVFPGGCRIAELPLDQWRKVMALNLDVNLVLMRQAHPFLQAGA